MINQYTVPLVEKKRPGRFRTGCPHVKHTYPLDFRASLHKKVIINSYNPADLVCVCDHKISHPYQQIDHIIVGLSKNTIFIFTELSENIIFIFTLLQYKKKTIIRIKVCHSSIQIFLNSLFTNLLIWVSKCLLWIPITLLPLSYRINQLQHTYFLYLLELVNYNKLINYNTLTSIVL